MNKSFQARVTSFKYPNELKAAGLYPYFRTIESEQDTEVYIDGRPILMFGSNSYLGLTNHPRLKEAAKRAINRYGTGCAGSRFLNGTLRIHLELEEALADYLQREAVLLYSTGFQSNLGAIAPLAASRHDIILIDERVHASIIDATRLSHAKVYKFKHNNVQDLERLAAQLPAEAMKFIVVDGVFSMEGDIAPLPGIVKVAEKYNGVVIVDDAHAVGVIGKMGIGTGSHFNMNNKVDVQTGTFSKSLASLGGFVAGSKDTIDYLKHTSRALIFSASMTPAAAASVLAAIDIIREEPERIQRLWDNTHYMKQIFNDMGFEMGHTESPILPLFVRDSHKTFLLAKAAYEDGLFVNPVVAPGVPNEEALIRFSLMATHSRTQIEQAADILYRHACELDILGEEALVPAGFDDEEGELVLA